MEQRIQIYKLGLQLLAQCEDLGLHIIGVCLENQAGKDIYDDGLQRMLDRIQRTAKETRRQAILVFDSGREDAIRRRMRRARVFNPIGSREGLWNSGSSARNIPTDRILGDPFFRNSEQDHFIQLADSTAYALLKYFEPPNEKDKTYRLKEMYDLLEPVTYKLASPRNRHGIVSN